MGGKSGSRGFPAAQSSAIVTYLRTKPELIAPAGNMECARAAVANGADAVYFGLPRFNARMRADNFTEEQLPELVRFLHEHRVRAFCTLNTLVFTDELAELLEHAASSTSRPPRGHPPE